MNSDEYLDNCARIHSHLTTYQKMLEKIDRFREKFIQISYLKPQLLLTENRKDIEYRINFLHDVLEQNETPSNTLYHQFVSDTDRNLVLTSEEMTNTFLKLTNDIKQNGFGTPIIVGKYDSKYVNTFYLYKEKNYRKNYKNKTGYQLIDGAHRLSIALFLKLDLVPVTTYKPLFFKIPDFTEYISRKESQYIKKIKK
tara:strand:- start:115 stop:705 length:591 start_codon:yes stop_codon:yes gene_type:complete